MVMHIAKWKSPDGQSYGVIDALFTSDEASRVLSVLAVAQPKVNIEFEAVDMPDPDPEPLPPPAPAKDPLLQAVETMRNAIPDHEEVRRQFWRDAWLAALPCNNIHSKPAADQALKDFDATFPPRSPSTEPNKD